MRDILSVNDLHVGVQRVSGTTPQTMMKLRQDLLAAIEGLFMEHLDKHIYINGDVFDAYSIDVADLLAFLRICCEWLRKSAVVLKDASGVLSSPRDQPMLVIAQGNHDISKDSSRLSSFGLLAALLQMQHPGRVKIITEPGFAFPGHYVIPHLANQEIFNLALAEAEKLSAPCYIHLHANYDNNFAVEQDHSLNVSAEQAKRLTDKQLHLVFGHEHQQRDFPGITIVGNQFPTSIADCLGNSRKRALVFHPDLSRTEIETWNAAGSFYEADWMELAKVPAADFVRVTGRSTQEEAAKVLQVISKFRQASDAYVVTSAVKFEGQDDLQDLEVAAADMKAVDVLEYLFEQLEPKQVEVVKKLLESREAA